MTTTAIIVAAGRGTRARNAQAEKPELAKQWQPLAGARVIDHTLSVFRMHNEIDHIVVVLHTDDLDLVHVTQNMSLATGGADRAASVRAGLSAAPGTTTKVLIHDVARPCISAALVSDVLSALQSADGAAPALPVTDALWTGKDGIVTGTQDRNGLWRAQTPQGFDFATIVAAHTRHSGAAADDVEVARADGVEIAIVTGDEDNLKITHPVDFARAERILNSRQEHAHGH